MRGKTPGHDTGFDIDEADLSEMRQCKDTVVASAIFGNYLPVMVSYSPGTCKVS